MSKRCPECRFINDDSRLFCASCGMSLDPQIRLIQNFEKQVKMSRQEEMKPERSEIKFYNNSKPAPKKKESSPLLWIILGAAILAAVVWFLFP